MKTLGASDFLVNLLAALPSLAGVLQIPGAIWGRRFKSYKKFVGTGGLAWRLSFVPFLFLPLAPIPIALKLTILTVAVACSGLAGLVNAVYNDWIANLIPESSRGFYFARRNAIAAIVGALVGIVGAVGLDMFRARHAEMLGFTAVFGLALLCAAISFFFFSRMADLERAAPVKQNLREGLKAIRLPFADRRFQRVLLFLGVSMAGQTFAGNLFVAFARESLALDYKVIQGTSVAMALGNVAAAAAWGFLADRYGNKPVLAISGALLALNPWPWFFCMPGQKTFDSVLLLSTHFLMGILWCGINLSQFNIVLTTSDPEDRANYIGAATCVTAGMGGVAPLLGAAMMTSLRGYMDAYTAYRMVFVATSVLRLVSVAFLLPVRERGSTDVMTTLRDMRGMSVGGMRVLRTLSRPTDVASREQALERAGELNAAMAIDEIIKSLHDPSPQVRRQAALALSGLDDPKAVSELIHQLDEHPALVDEETIQALASIGTLAAVPSLLRFLDSPRPLLRRAAARAIGRIASRSDSRDPRFGTAVDRLIGVARDPTDPDFRRAGLQALRALGSDEAGEVIAEAALDKLPSIRIAASEAIEALGISSSAENLRESLRLYADEANAEIAYALGVVGVVEDIPLILEEAGRSFSMITRRRCLLGIARLLDVEADSYRLLLMGGMERDAALQERLRGRFRSKPYLRTALAQFGAGDEAGALGTLALSMGASPFTDFAAHPVDELFVVASLAARQWAS